MRLLSFITCCAATLPMLLPSASAQEGPPATRDDELPAELKSLPRKLDQEPRYVSKNPRYCMLVFGPKAETRIWLTLDLAYDPLLGKPGKTESLFADLNGNGKLTDDGEKIPVTVKTVKRRSPITSFSNSEEYNLDLLQFKVVDVKSKDGKTVYKDLLVEVDWYVGGRADRAVTVSVDVPGHGRQSVGGDAFWFESTPAKSPVIWFDGALTMRMAPSGLHHFPVDYTGKEPPPPWHEVFPLVPGLNMTLYAQAGTPGIGVEQTFNVMDIGEAPKYVHPIAEVVFSHLDPKQPPIKVEVSLNKRCCGTLFKGVIAVPKEAALGKAKITYSFPAWTMGKVRPASYEIEVSDKDKRPKIFQEP